MVFNSNDFNDLLSELPSAVLITGDFNSHSTLWGGTKLDRRGKMVEDILTKHKLCVLNDTSPTYIHPATGSSSAIDLSICSPDIFLDMTNPTNYCPIALTSCACKIMLCMINNRLVCTWKETKLSHLHSLRFRKARSTTQTSLYVWSLLSERLLFRSSTLLLFSLISKRLTIQHGNLAF